MIKEGSRWHSINSDTEFEVTFIGLAGPGEENVIFYENILTKQNYSCWEGAFLERYKEIQNYGR